MNLIITVIGKDQIGIVAKVSNELANLSVNIADISQTLMQGSFTMMLLGKTTDQSPDFTEISERLNQTGESMKLSIRVQRQEIFDAIQKL